MKKWLKISFQDRWIIIFVILLAAGYSVYRGRRYLAGFFLSGKLGIIIFFTAFCGIAGELLLIYLYQYLYGYIYSVFALLIAAFMLGMSLGAGWMAGKKKVNTGDNVPIILFITWLILTGAYFLLNQNITEFVPGMPIFFLLFTDGFLNGWIFNHYAGMEEIKADAAVTAARTYSYDLYGSAAGSILSASVLFPYLGFTGSITVMAIILLLLLFLLIIYEKEHEWKKIQKTYH